MAKISRIPLSVFYRLKQLQDHLAKGKIKRLPHLWQALEDYRKASKSTGCGYGDYWQLYSHVKKHRPRQILECGTGVSTIVMAVALQDNAREGHPGKITSMESDPVYFEMAEKLLPDPMKSCVDICLSPVIEDSFSIFRGVRYQDTPMDKAYDFVYVDGPSYVAPSDKSISFDFDYLHILKHARHPVSAMIDKRVSTCYVLQKCLGPHKVTYNARHHIGYVAPCTQKDIRHFDPVTPSSAFEKSYSLGKNSKLRLELNHYFYS